MTTAIVIGAGLAGLQTAWYLNAAGIETTVLERLDGVALESSFANGGLITPSHAAPWNAPGIWKVLLKSIGNEQAPVLFRPRALPLFWRWGIEFLRHSSPERFRATIRANVALANTSVVEFQKIRQRLATDPLAEGFEHLSNGTLMLYRSPSSLEKGIANARDMESHGIACEVLDRRGVVEVEPALEAGAQAMAGGISFPADQSGNAYLYCRALADYLQRCGVTLRSRCEVLSLRAEGGRIRSVVTATEGELEADVVVVAGGVFSPDLAKTVKLDLAVRPVKGYSVTFGVDGWNQAPTVPVVDDDLHVGVTPLGKRLRAVGSAEFVGYDKSINAARLNALRDVAKQLYPAAAPYVDDHAEQVEWAGLRPMTPDCLPIVGRSRYDNLFLNTGHSYLGWTTGAATSRLVVDVICGRPPALDLAPYRADRF
ncbi:MAG: FAD-dependent oxidoreductase [Gammaproteobacteria bacterium]|nr:FAD-dependent oxidoreductase [Gammaproteobacteria bacterium]